MPFDTFLLLIEMPEVVDEISPSEQVTERAVAQDLVSRENAGHHTAGETDHQRVHS